MNDFLLKAYGCVFGILLFSFTMHAQSLHYIYVQSNDQKPFYIKLQDQPVSLAPAGYRIISRLPEGEYKIMLGIPQSDMPEMLFTVTVKESDAGYLLQQDANQGIYLQRLPDMAFVPAERQWPERKQPLVRRDDVFARVLAEVVNDSTINQDIIVKNVPAAKVQAVPAKISKPVERAVQNKTLISKIDQQQTAAGLLNIYVDNGDTVQVLMPVIANEPAQSLMQQPVDTARVVDSVAQTLTVVLQASDTVLIKENENNSPAPNRLKTANCKRVATQNDFRELFNEMSSEKEEPGRKPVAVRWFTTTCFTTEQIRELGKLFSTEEERYKFFVAAFPYVADTGNFSTLENQLTDNYYLVRFRAMVQQ